MLSWLNEHARASMRFEQFKSCRSNPIPILCIPWLLKVLQILFFLNSSLTSLPVIISDMYNTSQLYTIFYTYKIDLFCIKLKKKKKWLDFNLSWSNICSVIKLGQNCAQLLRYHALQSYRVPYRLRFEQTFVFDIIYQMQVLLMNDSWIGLERFWYTLHRHRSHVQWREIHCSIGLFLSNTVELTSSTARSTCKHGERGWRMINETGRTD